MRDMRSGVCWYEVTDYMVGPIVAIGVTWITMKKDVWESIPPDLQAIITEEGARHQRTSREWVETIWAQVGIDENTADGNMEYIEFSGEVKDALFQAGRDNVLLRWVERTGSPESETVQIYNEKATPMEGRAKSKGSRRTSTRHQLNNGINFQFASAGCRADGSSGTWTRCTGYASAWEPSWPPPR